MSDSGGGERRRYPRAWALAGLPVAFLAMMYVGFSTDVPYMDQWEFPAFFERWHEGTLTSADWFAQHNEHRIFFPRLIMLTLALLTDWDVRAELVVNAFLGFGITALVLAQSYFAAHRDGRRLAPWWPFAVTLLCCSLAQWQNWFLGWQLQLFLAVACIHGVIGLLLFTGRLSTHLLAFVLAVVATLSFASGLLVWPLAALACAFNTHATPRRRALEAPLWLALGLVAAALYFRGYASPGYHPPLTAVFAEPLRAVTYLVAYLGQPIAGFSLLASGVAGALALVLWGRGACRATQAHPFVSRLGLLWGLWTLGTAGLTVIARADLGAEQALSSRYATFALPLWLGFFLWRTATPQPSRTHKAVTLAVLALAAAASLTGAYRWTERYHVYESVCPALVNGTPVESLHWLYPETNALLERRAIAKRHGWSVFAP
jgi:hypothetical protein